MVERPSCDDLDNEMLDPEEIDVEGANEDVGILFAPGDSTEVEVEVPEDSEDTETDTDDDDDDDDDTDDGLGEEEAEATPEDGLGAGVTLDSAGGLRLLAFAGAVLPLVM